MRVQGEYIFDCFEEAFNIGITQITQREKNERTRTK